jgi:hypothetical protein
MEAELVAELPTGDWQYEPKWDGFRGILENDGGELALWSRNERPLLRYFPELRPLGDLLPPHSALDGEIVIARDGVLDFDSMSTRLHPAESRVKKLSAEIPAIFIAFDLLLWDGDPVHERPLEERRAELNRQGLVSPARPLDAASWLDRGRRFGVITEAGVAYSPPSRRQWSRSERCVVTACVGEARDAAQSTATAARLRRCVNAAATRSPRLFGAARRRDSSSRPLENSGLEERRPRARCRRRTQGAGNRSPRRLIPPAGQGSMRNARGGVRTTRRSRRSSTRHLSTPSATT